MADTLSKIERSILMSHVRGSSNKSTELRLIAIFRHNKITGWRRHYPLTGNPDFVFPKYRVAVFVDGCFWHGCDEHGHIPHSNTSYWEPKILRTKSRDASTTRQLRRNGWLVLRFWEHDAKTRLSTCLRRIQRAVRARTANCSASRNSSAKRRSLPKV